MRNITVTVDDETYRLARVRAAELDTSVSRLVRDYLAALAQQESDFDRRLRTEREIRALVTSFSASDRLSLDSLHERDR